uniref:Nuclear receptor domain-containing protein n=1 Tax=Meloidogyne enterolobii TaxID=390850 RepID=A0A6V7W582_MELEN|nr:unnamed protein product [Meloidogyne enterolobii]
MEGALMCFVAFLVPLFSGGIMASKPNVDVREKINVKNSELKCKICRYRKCISIGMKMTKDEKILEEKGEESFLQNFIEAYEEYVTFQQKLFFNIYPEKVYQQALVS